MLSNIVGSKLYWRAQFSFFLCLDNTIQPAKQSNPLITSLSPIHIVDSAPVHPLNCLFNWLRVLSTTKRALISGETSCEHSNTTLGVYMNCNLTLSAKLLLTIPRAFLLNRRQIYGEMALTVIVIQNE